MERKLKLRVDIDTRVAEQKLRNFERNVDRTRRRLNARGVDLDLDVNANAASAAEAGRAAREAAETAFGDRPLTVAADLNDRRFRVAYRRVQALLRRLTARTYNLTVDIDYDEDAFARLQDTIVGANEARRLKIDVEFDVDLESARAEVRAAREELALLAKEQSTAASTVSINVELDGASAVLSELTAIQTALAALPRQVTVDVDTRGGVDDAVTTAVTEATQATEGLADAAADAGASIADTLQALDAAQGILGRALPQTVKDQGVEALRAVNASAQQAVRDAINKTQDAFKGVKEKVTTRIEAKGGLETLRTIGEVEAAIAAVPGEVDVRFRADARDFFADSFTDVLIAKAEELAATQRFADEQLNRQRLAQQVADYDELGKALIESAKKAEEEATKLSRQAVAERGDVEKAAALNAKAEELRAKAVLERQAAEESQRLSRETAAKVEESSKLLRQLRRDAVTEQSQLFTTKGFEALARRIAQLAPANRPTDGDLVDVDAIRRQVDGVKQALDSLVFDGNLSPEVTLETAQFYAAIAAVEAELAKIDGATADASVDLDGLAAATADLLTYESLLERVDGDDITNRVEVKGLSEALTGLAALAAGRRAASGEVNIDVDVNRVGRVSRAIGGLARLAGGAVSLIGKAINGAASILRGLGNVIDSVGDRVQSVFSKITDGLGTVAGALGKAAGAVSAAAGPIASAVAGIVALVAGPLLVTTIVGAVTALGPPILAAIGGLIGGAIAFLGASAVAGLAAGGLPIAAVVLGPAKDEILKQVTSLKAELLAAFRPITDLITDQIVPAFVDLGRRIIPVAAAAAEGFITPIADSLYNLFADPALADAITRLSAPMAEGIASVIDTFAKFLPTLTDLALKVGEPLTNAFNSLLDSVLSLGVIFGDDIAGGFQVIADLLDQITPMLAGWGPILTPVLEVIAAIIAAFVEAGAVAEAQLGESFGSLISDIAAAIPEIVPALAAMAVQFGATLRVVAAAIPLFNTLVSLWYRVGQGASFVAGVVVAVIGKTIGGLSEYFERGLQGLQLLFAAAATGAEALRLPFADELRAAERTLGIQRELMNQWGESAYNAGELFFDAGRNFGDLADLAAGGATYVRAAGEAAETAAQRYARLRAQLSEGSIGFAEFNAAAGRGDGVVALTGYMDDLIKRIDDGAFALSNFIDEVYELPTAADFVEDAADPRQEARDKRDQARRLRDLQRQTVRDQQDIARAAQDYQDAIKEAAEARREAPEKYEWGADNFNAVLFADSVKRQEEYDKRVADAERSIQDRARALEDAQFRQEDNLIALADAQSDAIFGTPGDIEQKVIDINKALTEGIKKIQSEAAKARTLIQIRDLGADFDPLADFLEALDPAEFEQAIKQLGGVGSQAFIDAAAEINAAVDKGNVDFESALSKRRLIIAAEQTRLNRLIALQNAGATALVESLAGIEDVEQFNQVYEGIEAGIGFEAAERALKLSNGDLGRLRYQAEEYGFALTNGIENGLIAGDPSEKLNKTLETSLGQVGDKVGELGDQIGTSLTGLGEDISEAIGGVEIPASAEQAGEDTVIGFATGVNRAWDTEVVQAISTLVDELFTNVNFEAFAVAGESAAEKFYDGLSSAFANDINRSFALAALGQLEIGLRLRTNDYETIGNDWGGAVIAGIGNGLNADAGTLTTVFDLLADSIATDSIAEDWAAAGDTLGRAVMGGIEAGISDSREFLSGRLGAVRLGVTLQDDLWAEAGDVLGAAVVAGVADGIEADWQTVLTALELYADDVGRQLRPWNTAGEALGQALALGIASGLLSNRGLVAGAVSATLANPELPLAAVTQGEGIGSAFTAGIQRGLLLNLPVMLATATIVADSIAEVMRARLGINSPSRVTATIGEQIVDGLTRGITQGRQRAVGAAAQLATDTVAALSAIDQRAGVSIGLGAGAGAIGTGVGAALPQRVDAAAQSAVYTRNTNVSSIQERTVVEETTINVYGVQDGPAAANEIARRQRDRKFLRGRQ